LLSRVLFPQTILKGLGHTKSLFTISIIEAFVNLGLGLILFILFGIQGIAWSVVIAFLIEKVLLIALLFKKEGIKPSVYIPVPSTIIYSIILISVFIIKTSIF
jgi:peptidoglycan biosynthesis protein MviN/MurJ (putative lipid II flippase)